MRTRLPGLLALVAALAVLSLPTVAFAQASTTTLTATLTGEAEVPGPGDPDGAGTATITLRQSRVCFDMTWDNIGGATQAHIHKGAPGVAGPIVVTLFDVADPLPPGQNGQEGCVDAEAAVIDAIRQNPAGYYVNVHTPELPKGAIRGQLQAAPTAAGPRVQITTPCEHLRVVVTGLEPGQRINVIIFDTDNFRTANQGGVAIFATKLPAGTLGVQVKDASGNNLIQERIVTVRSCRGTLPFTGTSSTWPLLLVGLGLMIGGALLVRRAQA